MSLYEIAKNYTALLNIDDIPEDEIKDTLELIEGEFYDKALNIAYYFQNLESEVSAIKEAEQRMKERRQSYENKISRLQEYLKENMEATGIKKISCPYFEYSIASNPPSVSVIDEKQLPKEAFTVKTVESVSKTKIKEIIDRDGFCNGAQIVQTTRLKRK